MGEAMFWVVYSLGVVTGLWLALLVVLWAPIAVSRKLKD